MNLATLRVEGPDESLQELRKSLQLVCDTEWVKGDKRKNGRVNAASGFNATIADAKNPRELSALIRVFLANCKKKTIVFSSLGLVAELDIGFTVGDSEQFVGSIVFSPLELLSFGECGISLQVSAYPTSDEANAT